MATVYPGQFFVICFNASAVTHYMEQANQSLAGRVSAVENSTAMRAELRLGVF
jgi:hypothetical protein